MIRPQLAKSHYKWPWLTGVTLAVKWWSKIPFAFYGPYCWKKMNSPWLQNKINLICNDQGHKWRWIEVEKFCLTNQRHLPEFITATFNCEHSPAKLLTCHNQITSLKVNPVHWYICVDRNKQNKKTLKNYCWLLGKSRW